MKRSWLAALLALAALAAAPSCGDSADGSPFRTLGKRGALPAKSARAER